ncbi:PREDICTED: uncharacterized protein LOC101292912 [Fragaria vesca subsp. vesca]|uniref:uncharacterized protein LOC101292912 n=1 Tax=Fragaria vesca subsp. vesca TaxID=101020 RepID=UPI0002C33800|nr:PREDICTED: uncharacterized protein LOC101292912 [Fragaria vesca subsp. vesca]
MIGRKIRYAGKSKSSDYEEFKMSIRVARRLRRVRRARKARNGWMFGRKIRTGRQFIRPKFLDYETSDSEPKIVTFVDKKGVEQTLRMYHSSYPPPQPKVVKPPEPGYDGVQIFGDIADYELDEVVFTFGNEPGSIPIDAELSFIPPAVSKVGKAKRSAARPLHGFGISPESTSVCVA